MARSPFETKIRRLLNGTKTNPPSARDRGDRARDAGDWTAAAAAYRGHLDRQPDDAAIWVQLGHMCKEAGDLAGAGSAYARAAARDPASADALLHHGSLLASAGAFAEAEHALRASVAIDGNADARRELEQLEERQRPAPATPIEAVAEPEPEPEPEPAPPPPPRRMVGTIDSVAGAEISGWVVDPSDPSTPAVVEFYTATGLIGRATSTLFRSDVAQSGIGTTTAGFTATLDLDRHDKNVVTVQAFLHGTGEELTNSPFETTGFSPFRRPEGSPVTAARFAFAKRFALPPAREVALFVTHSPDGVLKPHVASYLEALRDDSVAILLIVAADRPVRLSRAQLDLVEGAMVRENIGYDFAAWGHALRLHPELWGCEILYLVNDSMFGPNSPAAFATMMARLRAADAELIGLTENHESGWHVQSFFLALKRPLLRSSAVQSFFANMVNLPDKQAVIDHYEIKLGPLVEAHGMRAHALFASNDPRNATMFAWRELIESGFPFVKTLLFRQTSHLFDIAGWERDLAGYGFDVALLKDTLKHHNVTGYVAPGFPLLAMPEDRSRQADQPLKVAFYGPWNYDNGLGAASRAIIAAIRRTGVRLNLHPVKKTFHIHRPLAPAFDIRDFEGPADVAIVHLNPDSWGVLTGDQRRDIDAARRRVGYWVWEMAHLPEGWRAEFGSVDRIWAPSRYCADLFDAQSEAPVDVVPHPVPLPAAAGADERAAALAAFGLPADRRILLYVFDGSSYLVRKNPHALVRAFAASGLSGRGWTLVLKTKHLMDRPEDGAAFRQMAEAAAEVRLVDRAVAPAELHALIAAADLYASPHCSEGFGLTIAEAMAAGKPVVATDYGGSTDFLDARSGYPVRADTYRLEDSFGHYTQGGEWARIDEAALAATLRTAAADVAAGDTRTGEAALRRIGDYLSYEAVAARIAASLAALFEEAPPRWPRPRPLDSPLHGGVPIDGADLGASLAIAPLAAGSLVPAVADELDRVAARSDRWLVFAPADARIDPHFRSVFLAYAGARPDVAIFYGDDFAAGDGPELGHQLRLKPDFDITLFAAQDYIGTPLIVRGSALHALGGLRHPLGAAALTDLLLRAWAGGMGIARIPEVLIGHPGRRPAVEVAARRAVLAAHPALAGCDLLPGLAEGTLRLARRFDAATAPDVTLLVPTRQSATAAGTLHLERLLDSLERTDWPTARLRILVGDDVAGPAAWTQADRPFAIRRIETPRPPGAPFNYAAKMNLLWRAAETEHVVMINDDVVATDPGWLKALMTFAIGGDVGAVGPLLLYENGTVQHAGIVGGLLGIVAHAWLYRRSTAGTYQDWALVHREWSMITGAVVATSKSMLERVDGFDERFALEYNDLDLCLRLRATGARIVYTPHARMTHVEKASRGRTAPPPEDLALFLRRWQDWLRDDPAFHPRMDHGRFDLEPGYAPDDWFSR